MNKRSIFFFFVIAATILINIGYASINSIPLKVSGTLIANQPKQLFIKSVEKVDSKGEVSDTINSYEGTLLNSQITLDNNKDSYITYKIVFYNNSARDYAYYGTKYDTNFYSNSNITFTTTNLEKWATIEKGQTAEINITFSYLDKENIDSNELSSYINFIFNPVATYMKNLIVSKYTNGGTSDDLTNIDLDNMTSDELEEMFGNISTSANSGLYKTTGIDGKEIMVFRGNINDNYVKFGGYLWRILQIDGEGNLKLILANSSLVTYFNSTSTIESSADYLRILHYHNSNVRGYINDWFKYFDVYQDKIVATKFCANFDYDLGSGSGSGNVTYYFQSYKNIGKYSSLHKPTFECPAKYVFTENVGLITAEEVVFAGGAFEKENTNYFLYEAADYDRKFWTLSPSFHDTGRQNGDVFSVNSKGSLVDWSFDLLQQNMYVRPVITIDGNYEMLGDGTLTSPYSYENQATATKQTITNLSSLASNKYYIAHIIGSMKVDGLLTSVSDRNGLLGKNTAAFSLDKTKVTSILGETISFENGVPQENGDYLYQVKSSSGQYLAINDDTSVNFTDNVTTLRLRIVGDGQILFMNEAETMYLNFYGAANKEGILSQFAGWNEIDNNSYMTIYQLD